MSNSQPALSDRTRAHDDAPRAAAPPSRGATGVRYWLAFADTLLEVVEETAWRSRTLTAELLEAATAELDWGRRSAVDLSSSGQRVQERTAELLAANRRLEAQWRRVRQVNDFQSEVLGKVAHDLKNPLNVILGRSEILEELFSGNSEGAQAAAPQLRHIRSSALRLTSMIDELITDAMNDALDITVRSEVVDLAAVVRDVAEANRPLAERKDQTIEFVVSGALPTLCDPERIREAIDNLVSNAVKYSRIGGAIRVDAFRAEDGNVVKVTDSGPGFMPEDMARLFGRFQRLSAKPTGGETSTGLGLSIVKKIVDLHDGSIAVTQGETGGASISISLTAARNGTKA